MNSKYKSTVRGTETRIDRVSYGQAKTEGTMETKETCGLSKTRKSVSTSRTSGIIKLRMSPREMPEIKTNTSTE